jgi:hypothetical protein
MPETILCRECKQPINKEVDQFVIIEKELIDILKFLPMLRVSKSGRRRTLGLTIC